MMILELEITKSEVELNQLIKSTVIEELQGENQIEEDLINTDFFKGSFSETNNCINNFLGKLEFDSRLG